MVWLDRLSTGDNSLTQKIKSMEKTIEKVESQQTYYTVRRLCYRKNVPYWEETGGAFNSVAEAEDYIANFASVKMRNKTLRFCIDEVRMVEFVEFV